jgi:chromosome segregation ATPase
MSQYDSDQDSLTIKEIELVEDMGSGRRPNHLSSISRMIHLLEAIQKTYQTYHESVDTLLAQLDEHEKTLEEYEAQVSQREKTIKARCADL